MQRKYIIMLFLILTSLLGIIILDTIQIKMCKSLSLFRIFTINSTVCTHIMTAMVILEKLFTTLVITSCSFAFQSFINYAAGYQQGALDCNVTNTLVPS
jgi:hypothetical protein